MKVYAILMAFVLILSVTTFVLAESNETDYDNNETETDENETEDDYDENETDYDENETEDDSNYTIKNDTLRNEYKEEREELREEYKNKIRNLTNESREEIRNLREEFKADRAELREEYKFKIRGENITFNYSEDKLEMIVGKINAKTGLNLTVEDLENRSLGQVLRVYMSNGRWAEVKIMPNVASETALKKLHAKCEERNCSIELKEIGNNKTNSTKAVYDIQTEKDSKVLGLFKAKMKVKAEVDAETGELIKSHKPWWAFIASEKDASDEEIEEETTSN